MISSVGNLQAGSLETLLMPGDVIEGHKEYEEQCNKCHTPFSKESQERLCLDCHEQVDHDIREQLGYHGKRPQASTAKCTLCHTEHIGRNADIVKLSESTFDHNDTDYPLEGRHQRTACAQCHLEGKKHREAEQICFSCHREDDYHQGSLGEKCADCHSPKEWHKSSFDHDKTKFPLQHRHGEINCNTCHPQNRYEKTPTLCISCHLLDDSHNGRFGTDCKKCHNDERWKQSPFDHDRETKFPLKDSHSKLKCDTCHTHNAYEEKRQRSCLSCHASEDRHLGQYGKQCNDCHNEKSWEDTRFDHFQKTSFPLHGKHDEAQCTACHTGDTGQLKQKHDCYSCHRPDDIHNGKQGQSCERCHNENGWMSDLAFDHDLTDFPLLGLHVLVPCEACHETKPYKGVDKRCIACHEEEDVHLGNLGTQCETCHNPNGWEFWQFDHNKQTRFPLDGAHDGLACNACHDKPMKSVKLSGTACVICHRRDDEHQGRFGPFCDRCHNTERWDSVIYRR
ncbi:MAG: cytochrome c3 family protein [Sedimenticola sp.]